MIELWGLGCDLMRFFAKDAAQAGDATRTLRDFHETYKSQYPHQALTLRDVHCAPCRQAPLRAGPGLGLPEYASRYMCTKPNDELQPDLDDSTAESFCVDRK
jgi:hypothetical protein